MNYYSILNISLSASDKEIKTAYRKLAKKYHPDTCKGDKKEAEKKMREINEAYDTLSNKELRDKYDEKMGLNKKTSNPNYSRYQGNNTPNNVVNKKPNNTYYDLKNNYNYNIRYGKNNYNTYYDPKGYAETNYSRYSDDAYKNGFDFSDLKVNKKDLAIRIVIILVVAVIILIGLINLFIDSINQITQTKNDIYQTKNKNNAAYSNSEDTKINKSSKVYSVSNSEEPNVKVTDSEESDSGAAESKLKEFGIDEDALKESLLNIIEKINKQLENSEN